METPEPPASEASTSGSVSVSEQARIRRERRKAKVGQGADRLKKITQTQKGTGTLYDDNGKAADSTETDTVSVTKSSAPPAPRVDAAHSDPPEIDISEHFYQPSGTRRSAAATPGTPSDAQLQQLMMRNAFFGSPGRAASGAGMGGTPGMDMPFGNMPPFAGDRSDSGKDPMMDLMAQMFGGAGAGAEGGFGGGLPPGLASMMSGLGGEPVPVVVDPYAKWWNALHAICAVLLALYAGWSFDGSREMRLMSAQDAQIPLFWYFATMELLLQSTRFVLEKGRPPPGSILSMIGSNLPAPFGTILLTLARYSVIWTTIWQDGLTVLFVLGICHWWNS